MKIRRLRVETQVNTFPIVPDDVLCPWIGVLASVNKLPQSALDIHVHICMISRDTCTLTCIMKAMSSRFCSKETRYVCENEPVNVEWSDYLWKGEVLGNRTRDPNLINVQVRVRGDDSTGREVHSLSHQVAPDTPLFGLQPLLDGLERSPTSLHSLGR